MIDRIVVPTNPQNTLLRDYARMCSYYCSPDRGTTHESCPIQQEVDTCSGCIDYVAHRTNECAKIIQSWAKEHPVLTNAAVFEAVFGERPSNTSMLGCEGINCPHRADGKGHCHKANCLYYNFWDSEFTGALVDPKSLNPALEIISHNMEAAKAALSEAQNEE